MTWGTTKTIRLQPAATGQKINGALKLGWAPYHAALSSWWLHQQTRNGRRRPAKLHKYICDFRNCGNSKAILLKSEFCKCTQEYSLPTYGYSKNGCSISNKYKTPVVPSTNIKKKELFVTPSIQWPFQEPKLEVPTIYKAYVREYPHKKWPYMVQYLHFWILKFPLIHWWPALEQTNQNTKEIPVLDAWKGWSKFLGKTMLLSRHLSDRPHLAVSDDHSGGKPADGHEAYCKSWRKIKETHTCHMNHLVGIWVLYTPLPQKWWKTIIRTIRFAYKVWTPFTTHISI